MLRIASSLSSVYNVAWHSLGISDVTEAYLAAIKVVATTDSHEAFTEKSIQEKANAFSGRLRSDQAIAVDKIHDGLQYLCYVIVSTSMPVAG